MTDGMDEEQVRRFDEEIGMARNPDEEAKKALRAHQEAAGMEFSDPDAEVGAYGSCVPPDEEVPGEWMGGPRRAR